MAIATLGAAEVTWMDARTGRSILHELTDTELQELTQFIESIYASTANSPIIEKDRWTLWSAIKQ
jgi:hypothetical protein